MHIVKAAALAPLLDRIGAAGGTLTARSAAGRGTTVIGWLPARRPEPVR